MVEKALQYYANCYLLARGNSLREVEVDEEEVVAEEEEVDLAEVEVEIEATLTTIDQINKNLPVKGDW